MKQGRDFEDFYAANYGKTTALVAGIIGDWDEAGDIAQEAFARALARWPRVSGYELPEAWVRPVQGGLQASATYTVSAPVSTLVVSSGVGAVTITGSQRSTVSVTEQVRFSARPPAMTRTLAGKTLTLGYQCPDESMCSASYDIQVPRAWRCGCHRGSGKSGSPRWPER